jgi:hypothetical protein
MKCPLAFVEKHYSVLDCFRKNCAWWNEDDNSCSIVSIANALGDIWDDIRSINEGWRYVVCELEELIRNEKHRRGIEDDSSRIL